MIHHVVYFELLAGADQTVMEDLVRTSRTLLLKIPEVLAVSSGRNLDPDSQWQFYFSFEVDSREKLRIILDDAYHLKLMEKVIKPHIRTHFSMDYELDPARDLKYS